MKERLNGEKETLGLYLTGHPIDQYEDELKYFVSTRIATVKPGKEKQAIAGLVVAFRVMKTKRGDTMAFVTLDDRTGRIEVAVFADTYNEYRAKLIKDALLVVEGQVSNDDFRGGLKMRADVVSDLDELRINRVKGIDIDWRGSNLTRNYVEQLQGMLSSYQGGACRVSLFYAENDWEVKLELGSQWFVTPTEELLQALRGAYGGQQVAICYS